MIIRKGPIETQAVVEPTANVIAGKSPTLHRFVVAATRAQITSPAPAAGRLLIDVPLCDPTPLLHLIDPAGDASHAAGFIPDKAMACE